MKVSKTYRLGSKTIMKIEVLSEKLMGTPATEIIEKAIEDFYDKEIKGIQCIPIDSYNELVKELQNSNQVILELNKAIQELLNHVKQLEYEKVSLEFKLKEKEKQLQTIKERLEKVPFWRKDLSELLNKDVTEFFKSKKKDKKNEDG